MPQILVIALPTPLHRLFEYLHPIDSEQTASGVSPSPGQRISVPFGRQTLVGILVSVASEASYPINKLKPIHSILDEKPVLSEDILELCHWAANYYHHPVGEVFHAALPIQLRRAIKCPELKTNFWEHTTEGKGLPANALKRSKRQQQLHNLLLEQRIVSDDNLKELGINRSTIVTMQNKGLISRHNPDPNTTNNLTILKEAPQSLNNQQQQAFDRIRYHHYNTYLLEGTTGSGKTEVYLHAIARALQAGHQALVLVPEIGLTPQTLRRFKNRFNVKIVELHSNISEGQRTQNWLAATNGSAQIVIGTRLAALTPMPKLGIIIIDEEHDLSFKQQDGFRYSARDLLGVRAHKLKIPVILGSATPSLETLYNANSARYQHLRLTQRAGDAQPPSLQLVDMRTQTAKSGISQYTLDAIQATINNSEQVLVFINRKGFAPALLCQHCGWTADCNNCDAKLTLHSRPQHLRCHHCNSQHRPPQKCPSCLNPNLSAIGLGTERCEEQLRQEFPTIDVHRVDQDSMQKKHAMKELTAELNKEEPCILVGTQMLAKGHHFPKVTLVVILDVDQGLFSGDFRGLERMGQQITQVAGRSGRGQHAGQVILQTYKPDHPMLQLLLHKGYHEFAEKIIEERKAIHLPPISYMAIIRSESPHMDKAIQLLSFAAETAKTIAPPSPDVIYLGPIPALMERRNNRFRFQFQITCSNRRNLQHLLKPLLKQLRDYKKDNKTRWSVDVDPQDMS